MLSAAVLFNFLFTQLSINNISNIIIRSNYLYRLLTITYDDDDDDEDYDDASTRLSLKDLAFLKYDIKSYRL